MRLGIEVMVHVLLLSLGCLIAAQFIGMQSGILQARRDFYTFLEQIEYSGMDSQQIRQCEELAEEKGYQLAFTELSTAEGEAPVWQLRMNYPICFYIPGMDKVEENGVMYGYVR